MIKRDVKLNCCFLSCSTRISKFVKLGSYKYVCAEASSKGKPKTGSDLHTQIPLRTMAEFCNPSGPSFGIDFLTE